MLLDLTADGAGSAAGLRGGAHRLVAAVRAGRGPARCRPPSCRSTWRVRRRRLRAGRAATGRVARHLSLGECRGPLLPGAHAQRGGVEGGGVPRPHADRQRRRSPRPGWDHERPRQPPGAPPHAATGRAGRQVAGARPARSGSPGRPTADVVRRRADRPGWHRALATGGTRRGSSPLDAPPGRFYADPFVVARPDGGAHVFVEDGPLDGGPARLSVLDARRGRRAAGTGARRPRAPDPPLLSLRLRGRGRAGTCCPRPPAPAPSSCSGARRFPWDWEPHAVLLRDVRAWDPTLLRHDGRYWLFVTMAAPGVRPSDGSACTPPTP